MSGGYKYTDIAVDPSVGVYDPTLACVVLGSILAERLAQAAIETVRRLEAEEGSLAAHLNGCRSAAIPEVESVRSILNQSKPNLLHVDHSSLCRRISQAETNLESARTHIDLQEARIELGRIQAEVTRAVRRKEAEDARTGSSQSMAGLRARYEALKLRTAGLLGGPGEGPLGPAGAARVKSALANAGAALQTTNEAAVASRVDGLEAAVSAYEDSLRQLQEQKERHYALLLQGRSEASAIISGLRADPVVCRWHSNAVDELERDICESAAVPEFEPHALLAKVSNARVTAAQIVKEANAAQIKADQRDYIARSISSTLEEMGFIVAAPFEEHPGHPATSSIVHAATVSGKAISVSVPVEGQVWYNVEGYVKAVEAAVGGGTAAVCDEAQEVIEQMQEALASEFHIQTGELQWEGKDPNRKLRAAKSIPQDSGSSRSGI